MVKFDKLNSEEVARIGRKIVGTVVLVATTTILAGMATLLNSTCTDLQAMEKDLQQLVDEEQQLENSINEKTLALSNIKIEDSIELPSREDLVVILGDCAQEAGVSIVGLNSAAADIEDSITKYNFVFELKGTTPQIAKALAGIDAHELHYAINEMSLRQEGDYLWLQRNFKEQITWWDLSNVTTAGGFQSRVNITADDIISDDVMTLYLDLNFIFVNNSDTTVESVVSVTDEESLPIAEE